MIIYRTASGVLVHIKGKYVMIGEEWDKLVNQDQLHGRLSQMSRDHETVPHGKQLIAQELLPPIGTQELWASGVTYLRSKQGRQEESAGAGGGDYYQRVYEADRPELFFKANANRVVGHGDTVRIRADSSWNVPEPELTLLISASGKITGYTIGNDMSSRSIEGENPLYLPQAKTYDGCAAIGPGIYITPQPLPGKTIISMQIFRAQNIVFSGEVEISQIKRSFEQLAEYLYRECSFPFGSLLMTGTGIVPGSDFTLQSGDKIQITIEPIGTLINEVA